MTPSERFLEATDRVYDECAGGIADLDKIIVGTPELLVGRTRTALVPTLYAYWERFFRVVMGEFLQTVSSARLSLDELNTALAKLRVKRAIRDCIDVNSYQALMAAIDKHGLPATSATAKRTAHGVKTLIGALAADARFVDPETWIDTEANVRYEVIAKNYRSFGLKIDVLKATLEEGGFHLYPGLKDLVDTRNKIAHGEVISPTTSDEWEKLRTFTVSLMNALQLSLHRALDEDAHKGVA